MEHQQFGRIETAAGVANAMLCIDDDRPDEMMVSWSGADIAPAAVLADSRWEGATLHLVPRLLYQTLATGSLYLPTLSEEQVRTIQGTSAKLVKEGDVLEGEWTGPDGTKGHIRFREHSSTAGHIEAHQCGSWNEFKAWANEMRATKRIASFRGHGSSNFRLRTTLSRAGRNRLERYCAEELREFCAHAEAVLGMRFNLNDGDDYSTVMGLAQHHGLPTPLLDWTASPYIAAFFAFSDALEFKELRPDATHVRVYALTQEFINANSPLVVNLPRAMPYVDSLYISPRYNPRLYAQQGMFLVTNVANLEHYIEFLEHRSQQRILFAADIPISYAVEALEDLKFMGLTAATMFPGLDGVGRMIRHKMSFKKPVESLATISTMLADERTISSSNAP